MLRRLSENGYFPQSLRQAQILILKILNVFLRLKSSPSLTLQKISHSRTASYRSKTADILNTETWIEKGAPLRQGLTVNAAIDSDQPKPGNFACGQLYRRPYQDRPYQGLFWAAFH